MSNNIQNNEKPTIKDWLFGCVNFSVPESAVDYILDERNVAIDAAKEDTDKMTRDLLKADLYVWICNGAGKVSSTTDSDNGWSHTEAGYTLSDSDKERMLNYAKAIYEKYDEEVPFDDSVKVSVSSFGVMPCNFDIAGNPIPHFIND